MFLPLAFRRILQRYIHQLPRTSHHSSFLCALRGHLLQSPDHSTPFQLAACAAQQVSRFLPRVAPLQQRDYHSRVLSAISSQLALRGDG